MKTGVNRSTNVIKIKFFNNLTEKKLSDTGAFWKEITSYFSDRENMSKIIMLVQKDKVRQND